VQYIGARNQLMLGPGMAAVGLLWLSRVGAGDAYLIHVLGPVVLIGLGIGMSFVPMTLAATAGVPMHEAGLASGLINTTRQIGGALGLAVMATVATSIAAGHGAGHHAVDASLTSGYRAAFVMAGCGLIIGALLATLLPRRRAPIVVEPAVAPAPGAEATRDEPAPGLVVLDA
jgi:MFS family permease